MSPKAIIFGCRGTVLTAAEADFFTRHNPLGFILFARNCESPSQVRALVDAFRECVGREDAPVLIDQEGGRVARLTSPTWRDAPPAGFFGQLMLRDPDLAIWATHANAWLMGLELAEMGINVNCAPVCDLLSPSTHAIIGNRSFGDNIDIVSALSMQVIQGLRDAGITPVIKHLPGHGRAASDSHLELPIVRQNCEKLAATDFVPFHKICDCFKEHLPWGMTAHITYPHIDSQEPATHSHHLIHSIIRGYIGFSGFLISDCLTMKALNGTLEERAKKAIQAGCDAVLHCSGDLEEMMDIAPHVGPLSEESSLRCVASIMKLSYTPPSESVDDIRKRLDEIVRTEGKLS